MRLHHDNSPHWRRVATAMLASTTLATSALAQDPPTEPANPAVPSPPAQAERSPATEDEVIVVTATKRAENLQDVPIAITAITTKTLEDTQVDSFDDYAKAVPSLSYKSFGPGSSNVYFRGVASGENANHSASLPSVGTYLDEQPITTITGALDVHIFDIARVEALAGPQGTLYGASSQAGTIRIITNKPDFNGTYGAVNLELNKVAHGDWGYTGEGYLNFPISTNVAARIVGWYRRDGGYIDNIRGVLEMPAYTYDSDLEEIVPTGNVFMRDNDEFAEDDYNDVDTYGARAALRIDLNENWTITPQLMGQVQEASGSFAEERGLGELETMQFNPEKLKDQWFQAAMTVEGKLGNFDVTYAGAYMMRQIDGEFDYIDYAYFYNNIYQYGAYWYDNAGNPVSPDQFIQSDDSFTKQSHELRFTSPADKRLRLVAGLFYQRQTHNIEQNYIIPGITDDFVVPGTESNIWLTKQLRIDRDYAAFGELSFDITPELTATAGGRWYKFDNSLVGFFGFSENYSPDRFDDEGNFIRDGTGVAGCNGRPPEISGTPCTNLDSRIKDSGFVHRLNLTYKPNEDLLLYGTWSRGFRPGGVNRRSEFPPYKPDFLTNYEAGAKYSFGRGAHFNIAGYLENWDDIQVSLLGENGLTVVRNVGKARIWGVEADLLLRPMDGLTWSTGVAYNRATLQEDFCFVEEADPCVDDFGLDALAEEGDKLPLTAPWKANSRIRYEWNLTPEIGAHVQAAITYEGKRKRDLRPGVNDIYRDMKAYTLVDAAAGIDREPWSVELYIKNLFDTRAQLSKSIQCVEQVCGDPFGQTEIGGKVYTVVSRPRTIGLRVGYKF